MFKNVLRNTRIISKITTNSNQIPSRVVIQHYSSQIAPIDSLKDKVSGNDEIDPSSPSVSALLKRVNVEFSDPNLIKQVLTHSSYNFGKAVTNERLRFLGKKVLGLYITEYYHVKYPNIPVNTMEDIIRVHYDPYALSKVAQAFGFGPLIRWKADQPEEEKPAGFSKVLGKSLQAFIGAIYHDKGSKAAKEFIHQHLLTRDVDVISLLPLSTPKKSLVSLLKIKGKEAPVSRLLKETGRLSNRPIFIVGVYSGDVKLGESYGSSLKMAEFRACKDALIRYHLDELKDFQLPSDVESMNEDNLTFFPTKIGEAPTRF